ncbi:hypothetical protein BH24ACI3_BH24ACI3_16890 [soil metagenome]
MSITIDISEKTEKKIRRRAEKMGQSVDEVVGALVEGVWDEQFPEDEGNEPDGGRLTMNDLTGLFSSKTPVDTSQRASEILRAELGRSSLGQD